MIAKPFSPGNAFPAEDVARERLTFDKAMIGSCTNGSYEDLLTAALVISARAATRRVARRETVRRFSRGRVASAARSNGPIRGSAAIHRGRVSIRRRRDPPVVVRSLFWSGP